MAEIHVPRIRERLQHSIWKGLLIFLHAQYVGGKITLFKALPIEGGRLHFREPFMNCSTLRHLSSRRSTILTSHLFMNAKDICSTDWANHPNFYISCPTYYFPNIQCNESIVMKICMHVWE